MRYLLQSIRPVYSQVNAYRPAFTATGTECVHLPCLNAASLLLPASVDAKNAELAAHIAWMTAQSIKANMLACAQNMRGIDLENVHDGEAVAKEIFRNRMGKPWEDGLMYILIPEQIDRAFAIIGYDLHPARRSEAIEAQAAAFSAALQADPKAVAKAKKIYLDAIEKAVNDPEIMQFMFMDGQTHTAMMMAFDRAEYVQSAKSKIAGGAL